MPRTYDYYVYILSSRTRRLYVGTTKDLARRIEQHKAHEVEGFTSRYNVDHLVYYEETDDVHAAIERGHQIKAWRREKKVALIESVNPSWRDLAVDGSGA